MSNSLQTFGHQIKAERSFSKYNIFIVDTLTGEGICNILVGLPGHLTEESFEAALAVVRTETMKNSAGSSHLTNWLHHKDSNPWIFRCICYPLTSMHPLDWVDTSFHTNIAESAHALSQRYGKQLTLMGAIQAGQRLDSQYFRMERVVQTSGINVRYGNNSGTGRTKKNLNRRKAHSEAAKRKSQPSEKVLAEAKSLIDAGISAEVIEQFLSSKSKSS